MSSKSKSAKSLACRECGEMVHSVGSEATAVTCSACVSKSLRGGSINCDEENNEYDKDKKHSIPGE